jgi:exopolyphosphatase/guanosine-5'-triphosphate,3'-diphosphate pyrophosphatase
VSGGGETAGDPSRARIAVVDIGSNSIHLLVADRTYGPRTFQVRRVMSPATLLALGRTVAGAGRIDTQAQAELTRVVARQVKQAERAGATELYLAATAAVRQAANGRNCMAQLARELGHAIHVLTEDHEAELGFLGLVHDLDPVAEQLVIDCGGGSTEVTLAHGRRRGPAASLAIGGCLLSLEYGDPPTREQMQRLQERVERLLRVLPAGRPTQAIATGGTARKLPLIGGGHSGTPIDLTMIERAQGALQAVPAAVLAKGTGLQVRRVQSLAAGAVILASLFRQYGLNRCRTSPHGLREGIVLAAAADPEHWWVDVRVLQARRERFADRLAGGFTNPDRTEALPTR